MKDTAAILVGVVGFIAILSISIWWQATVWSECRAEHSWMYCVTLISRK